MAADDGTMSVTEAAEQLGVSRQHLTQLVKAGDMPATKVYGMWRIHARDVKAARDGRERTATTRKE